MKNQKILEINYLKLTLKTCGFFIFQLLLGSQVILSVKAATPEPVLSIVNSPDNNAQWATITKRVQAAGIKYCVISLGNVQTASDWGERKVLFLPNIETLSPAQAIALEEWVNKGGRLIVSGAVGNASGVGVRQLLRKLLGGYWGFNLNNTQQLQPPINNQQTEIKAAELFGKVQGGVIIREDVKSQAVAVWNVQVNTVAVLTTERSTFLGWRWGNDNTSSLELDRVWLKAAIARYLKQGTSVKVPDSETQCDQKVTIRKKPVQPQIQTSAPITPPQPRTNFSLPATIQNTATNEQEAIDQLQEAVKLDIIPNSSQPITYSQAIALQQELENLTGRVESAHLAAAAHIQHHIPTLKQENNQPISPSLQQILTQAREVAKNIPVLVQQKQYALVRQQWLKAKTSLWQNFPLNHRLAQPEIRAVWLDRGTIVKAGSEAGLAVIFDRLSQAGINTVFFETVNASYPIYPSTVAPQRNPLIKDWDPLASGVKLAHARGMELHAWVWTFAAGNKRHNELLKQNSNYLGPVLEAHPDWANYDNQGNVIPIGQTKPFLDPAHPQVRAYLIELFTEIVSKYEVDGLHLDYIRYPFQDPAAGRTYGYGKAAREQFKQLTGLDPMAISPSQRELWQKWTEFRTQQINSFVAEVAQMTRQQRPNLILSVAVFPLLEFERVQKLQQNWEVWARQGDVDLIIPMTYALDTPRFQRLAQPWINSTKLGATLLVPGIRLLSLPSVAAFDQLQLVRNLPTIGYALFAAENFHPELEQIFTNTQGKTQNQIIQPIPQRQPFQVAALRYAALQREWQLIQQQGNLTISANTNFNLRTQELQRALNQLAAVPSAANFITARSSLNRLKLQFSQAMSSVSAENPYLVKVWENQLLTIERLLRYGERRSNLQR